MFFIKPSPLVLEAFGSERVKVTTICNNMLNDAQQTLPNTFVPQLTPEMIHQMTKR